MYMDYLSFNSFLLFLVTWHYSVLVHSKTNNVSHTCDFNSNNHIKIVKIDEINFNNIFYQTQIPTFQVFSIVTCG
jgi:hypothetical protein